MSRLNKASYQPKLSTCFFYGERNDLMYIRRSQVNLIIENLFYRKWPKLNKKIYSYGELPRIIIFSICNLDTWKFRSQWYTCILPVPHVLENITANNTQKGIFNRNKTRGEKDFYMLMLWVREPFPLFEYNESLYWADPSKCRLYETSRLAAQRVIFCIRNLRCPINDLKRFVMTVTNLFLEIY